MVSLNQVLKLLCICVTLASCSNMSNAGADDKIRQVCSVTRYVDVCIHSLAAYSKTANKSSNYTTWARAGVSVALSDIKNTTHYLHKMNASSHTVRGRMTHHHHQAIIDCVECFNDASDSLHKSLSVLRELDKVIFDEQMADVMTWVSAALTDEDTCLDGFDEDGVSGRKVRRRRVKRWRVVVMDRVRNCIYVTSNALALLNKLASTGL